MSYTKGPWIVDGWSVLDKTNRTVICDVLPWDVSGCRKEDVDNANLVAAAPDLFEALEEVLDGLGFISGGDHELEGLGITEERGREIRNILKKARGE